METIFKKGMTVYDNIFFPNSKGEVVRIDKHIDCERVFVQFDCLDYELSYTTDGRYYTDIKPTLATKPYIFEGFEQKALVPTFEEAWTETDRIYEPKSEYDKEEFGGYPSQDLANAAESLRRLLFLRDYYNEGWMADWNNSKQTKYTIEVYLDELWCESYRTNKKILSFKNDKIRDKFLEEQRELLEIAKPLL